MKEWEDWIWRLLLNILDFRGLLFERSFEVWYVPEV
jgi:hypothetical protein